MDIQKIIEKGTRLAGARERHAARIEKIREILTQMVNGAFSSIDENATRWMYEAWYTDRGYGTFYINVDSQERVKQEIISEIAKLECAGMYGVEGKGTTRIRPFQIENIPTRQSKCGPAWTAAIATIGNCLPPAEEFELTFFEKNAMFGFGTSNAITPLAMAILLFSTDDKEHERMLTDVVRRLVKSVNNHYSWLKNEYLENIAVWVKKVDNYLTQLYVDNA